LAYDTKLGIWIAYIKKEVGIATQVSMIKVKVTGFKKLIQIPLNYLSLLWHIDTNLGVCYIKRQLGNATQVSIVKVNVTCYLK
jgi:hypothetical protein